MTRPTPSAEAVIARLGMSAESAVPALRTLGLWEGDGPTEEVWPVVEAVAASPNPELALQAFTRLVEHHPQRWYALVAGETDGGPTGPGLVTRAARVASGSEALGDLYATSPPALEVLIGELRPWTHEQIRDAVARELAEAEDLPSALAAAQRRGLLRIAARDLLDLADTPTVSAELADLAEGILRAAFAHVAAEAGDDAPRITVIGMGKLGGRELNYISDIDVLFVTESDEVAEAGRICQRLLRLFAEHSPQGRAYEVDANLRPEGRDGPLVRSMASYEAYYSRWADTWEFQALLKARPVAGDHDLGAEFVELVAPHVWPDRLGGHAVDEIQRMKARVEESAEVRKVGARQVKLAPGGIRDIEFAVQLLQLVHGRHDESLRSPNTLAALGALAAGGFVGEDDAAEFREAYVFLRTVEHRLQLDRLRRTHTLPDDDVRRRRLARTLGFAAADGVDALERFDNELRRVQGLVRRLHEKLFYRPLLGRFADVGRDAVLPVGGEPGLGETAALDRLAALGFTDAAGALGHLEALAAGVTRRAQLFRTLLPALLPVLADTPDPDGGLVGLRSLVERLENSPFFLRTLRDTPPVGEVLMRVLGASRLVGEWLERQPEVFGALADLAGLARQLEPADYRRLADGLLRRNADVATASDALRRLRRREVARTAVRDLDGQADAEAVAAELTGLAEACLEAGLALALRDTDADLRMAVIGLGKLGGRELGYASDLDVLVVCEPTAGDQALRATERLLELLSGITPEGQAFIVDPNLRPEGKDGALARTLASYRRYYERWAEPWELQALTQARHVAGDVELGTAFCEAITDLVYPAELPAERLHAMRRMKARVERERGGDRRAPRSVGRRRPTTARRPGSPTQRLRPGAPGEHAGGEETPRGGRVDLKLGPGGLADIDWTVQLLQQRHGAADGRLRVPGTLAGVAALEDTGLLPAQEAEWLRSGYRLLTSVRNALFLSGHRDTSTLPARSTEQDRLALMLGFPRPGSQALAEELSRASRRIRKVHEQWFYDA